MNELFIMWIAQPKMPPIWAFVGKKRTNKQINAQINTLFHHLSNLLFFFRLGSIWIFPLFWVQRITSYFFFQWNYIPTIWGITWNVQKTGIWHCTGWLQSVRFTQQWFQMPLRNSSESCFHGWMLCVRGKEQFQMKQGFVRCPCDVGVLLHPKLCIILCIW